MLSGGARWVGSRSALRRSGGLTPLVSLCSRATPPGSAAAAAAPEPGQQRAPQRSPPPSLVDELNPVLVDYPMPSFISFIGLSYTVFGVSFFALKALGFDFPALAVAGVVSRMTRWAKRPLDLGLAVALARAFPATTLIRLGPLIVPPTTVASDADPPAPASASASGGTPRGKSTPDASGPSRSDADADIVAQWARFATRWLEGPVNTYGAPFLLARWVTGLSLVGTTTALVHSGVDVTSYLGAFFAAPEDVATASTTASAVAGAMVFNTLTLPVRVLAFGVFARPAFAAIGLRPATAGAQASVRSND